MKYAKVVVDIKVDQLEETYDYTIPEKLEDVVGIGSRVHVSFGYRKVMGYVIDIKDDTSYIGEVKPILSVLDYDQELNDDQLELARYISRENQVSLVSVLDLMIPSFLRGKQRKYIDIVRYEQLDPYLALLFNGKKRLPIDRIINKDKKAHELIKKQIENNNITLDYNLFTYGRGLKTKEFYVVDSKPVLKSEKRYNIYNYVLEHRYCTKEDIITYIDCSYNLIADMVKNKTLLFRETYYPTKKLEKKERINDGYEYTFDDLQTIAKYKDSNKKKFLLMSRNEKFKFKFLIDTIIESKDLVVVCAPNILIQEEILLNLNRFLKGYRIQGISSKVVNRERYDVFMNIKYSEIDVLVTTPSGIFMPWNKLETVIIIDEESNNYITDRYPYYRVKDVLEKRVEQQNGKIILMSSNPSIETYYKAINMEYISLKGEDDIVYNKKIIDMRKETMEGNSVLISSELEKAIEVSLSKKEQVLIIVPFKSYANLIICSHCNKVVKCPNCHVSLSLHSKGYGYCKYCNHRNYKYNECSCGSDEIRTMQAGIDQIYEYLSIKFKNANIIKASGDNFRNTQELHTFFNQIDEREADIIVGTSILQKKIETDNITTVGIQNIDVLLNSSSHRAKEEAFNFVNSFSHHKTIYIQTFDSNNQLLNKIVNSSYDEYYKGEIENRKLLGYEPFKEVSKIVIKGDFKESYHFANYFKKVFLYKKEVDVLGPGYDSIKKGAKLIVKHNDIELISKVLNDTIDHFRDKRVTVEFERYPKVI